MKVLINDDSYVPASAINGGADETAKAILRALTSGYYGEPECHQDGGGMKPHCDCCACHLYRVRIQFLGDIPKCDEENDAGFQLLWKATDTR